MFATAFLADTAALAGPWSSDVAAVATPGGADRQRGILASTPVMAAQEKRSIDNPLWTVPLGALSETVTRPLFSPSRRPPAPPVAFVPPTAPLQPPSREPDHPMLTLLGTIVSKSQSIAVLLDQTSSGLIRLRTGQAHAGWVLRSVGHRVAIFERERQEFTLALPAAGTKQKADVALDTSKGEYAGVCADGRMVGPLPENCAKSGPPAVPVPQTSANSRKKRWHDAHEAAMARRGR
jgi:hypothetical protein